jgi:hypothetical protein
VGLINLDGVTLVGPGSQWFWTMLQLVVVAVSLVGVYRQVRLQRSASAIQQLNTFEAEWGGERFSQYRLEVLLALRDGTDPASVPYPAAFRLGLYWDKVAALVKGGHIDAQLLWRGSGGDCFVWWLILGPWVRGQRQLPASSTTYAGFEWLASAMREIGRHEGIPPVDEAWVARTIPTRIATNLETIRVERSLRTMIVQPGDDYPSWRSPETNAQRPGTADDRAS